MKNAAHHIGGDRPWQASRAGIRVALQRILEQRHRGASNSATGADLVAALVAEGFTHVHLRRIGEAVHELRLEGVPVASRSVAPAGYFIVETAAERLAFSFETRKRIAAMNQVLRAVDRDRASAVQLALDLQTPGAEK